MAGGRATLLALARMPWESAMPQPVGSPIEQGGASVAFIPCAKRVRAVVNDVTVLVDPMTRKIVEVENW